MGRLAAPVSGVTVRMYRQGLGDCFLLAFPTDQPGAPFYLLIDCGVILGTKDPEPIMRAVAADIREATGGDIHLLVATHEHWDHLSGFIQAGETFRQMRIHNLWLAWTEDPADPLATRLRAEFQRSREALRVAVGNTRDPGLAAPIRSLLEFFGEGLGAAGGKTTQAALQALRDFAAQSDAAPRYLRPGGVEQLPGVPGARLYVLGPPRDEATLERVNPSAKGKEVYTEGAAPSPRTAFAMAVMAAHGEAPLSADDRELLDLSHPFDQHVRIARAAAERDVAFAAYGEPGSDWRRIDDDWLGTASELALQLDSYTNNTSVALAIELVKTKKVLLLVADAQVGNWLSWADLTWSVEEDAGKAREVKIGDLLARTVLYKVGHHGSHNATLRAQGLELMVSPDLVAMVPVHEKTAREIKHWLKMPFSPLMQRLAEKTGGRVMRVDDAFPKPRPEGMSGAAWQAFKENFAETELYLQYTVADG